jgi:hypothetical protein
LAEVPAGPQTGYACARRTKEWLIYPPGMTIWQHVGVWKAVRAVCSMLLRVVLCVKAIVLCQFFYAFPRCSML